MYYMLNLIFNYNDNTALNGRFIDYVSGQDPLLTSKAWLTSSDGANWGFSQTDHQHLTFPLSENPILMVRVVDANQGSDSYTARITVLMGRNDQKSAQQSMSSPIQNTNSITGPLCTWDTGLCTADSDLGNTACWVTTLGQASLGSGTKGNTDLYLFLVAAYVQGNVQGTPTWRTFSHDPDMNIDC